MAPPQRSVGHPQHRRVALSMLIGDELQARTASRFIVELADRPATSHAARTDQDDFGKIFRRNTAFGSARRHGTMFVGFCDRRQPLADMLDSMAGLGGVRDALTLYTSPLTGAYYFIPSLGDLALLAPPKDKN